MKKYIIVIILSIVLLLSFSRTYAQNIGSNNQQASISQKEQVSNSYMNSSEENQIQNENNTGTEIKNQSNGSEISEIKESQRILNETRQANQTMLNFANQLQNESIENQIKTIANNQIQSENKISLSMNKIENTNKFLNFLFGPNYKELKNIKQELIQNQLRIRELEQIKLQMTNPLEQIQLENQIKIMENLNTQLQNQLNDMEQGFSLLGWLFKWINNY